VVNKDRDMDIRGSSGDIGMRKYLARTCLKVRRMIVELQHFPNYLVLMTGGNLHVILVDFRRESRGVSSL